MQPITSKTIKIVSLDSKEFSGANGPWIKYSIKADDNQFYSTTDAVWFANRKLGEVLLINFYTTAPTVNRYGKTVTYNNIVIDSNKPTHSPVNAGIKQVTPPAGQMPGVAEGIMRIISMIKESESNIIDAIRLHCGSDIEGIETTETKTFAEQVNEPEIPVIDENNPF